MQWSKIRTRIKNLICDELRDRIDVHVTGYPAAHDGAGEAWFTVDGVKVFGAGDYKKENSTYRTDVVKSEIHSTNEVIAALHTYLSMSVQNAFLSENPLLVAMAIIDRRTGRRVLDKFIVSDHPLVKAFHLARTE